MRYALTLLTAAALLATLPAISTAQEAQEKLVGKWEAVLELDEEKLKKLMIDQGIPEDQLALVLPTVREQFNDAKIVMEFKADGTQTAEALGAAMANKSNGTWKVKEADGNTLTIESTSEESDEKTIVKITFDGKDKFTAESDDLKEAPIKKPTFTRIKD